MWFTLIYLAKMKYSILFVLTESKLLGTYFSSFINLNLTFFVLALGVYMGSVSCRPIRVKQGLVFFGGGLWLAIERFSLLKVCYLPVYKI